MRISRLLLIVLLLASSYGCSEEEPYEVEKKSVSIWAGDTWHVIIETDLTEYNYRLESENQEIATAILDENERMHHYLQKWKHHDTTYRY